MALADYIGKYWAGAEVMYGVIIAMTFTSVLRGYPGIFEFVVQRVTMTALFCCIAWGIADGLFYLWERNYIIRQENTTIELSRTAQQKESALALIREQLDDTILRNISRDDRSRLYEKLSHDLSGVDGRRKVSLREAVEIVLGTFLLSAGAGAIVVLPFFVIDSVGQAVMISNLAGILLLFGAGYFRALSRDLFTRMLYGVGSSSIGIIIAVLTIVLGG